MEYVCRFCSKKLSSHLKNHEKNCKSNPNYIPKKLTCRFCGKICKTPCGLAIHERVCKSNPNRRPLENNGNGWKFVKHKRKEGGWDCYYCGENFGTRRDLEKHKHECHSEESHIAWNKGKTKETDERIKIRSESVKEKYKLGELKPTFKGKHHSEETKKKISEIRKAYLKEHPDKVPYIINHHSKGPSYPERYFMRIFYNVGIKYEMNYRQCGYFLDFAWPDKKIYFEVDGEQHYLDKRISEHDKIRNDILLKDGWVLVDRLRWSEYQKLSLDERKNYISTLLDKISADFTRNFTKKPLKFYLQVIRFNTDN